MRAAAGGVRLANRLPLNANLDPEQARVAFEAMAGWAKTARLAPKDTAVHATARAILLESVESSPHAFYYFLRDDGIERDSALDIVRARFGQEVTVVEDE